MARPSAHSLVIAVVGSALALAAIGGGAYAAGRITGAQIQDKTLGPNDLLVRVASAQTDNNAVTGTTATTTALKVKIVAPTKGYLIVTASSDVFDNTNTSGADAWIEVGGKYALGSSRTLQLDPSVNGEEDSNIAITIPVAQGPHNVAYVVDPFQTTTIFDETTLQAEFVPFNGMGLHPTNSEIAHALESPVMMRRHNR